MRNKCMGITAILVFIFFIQISLFQAVWADEWVQTTQPDFESGTKFNIDTVSDPGNVTLSQAWNKIPSTYILDIGPPASWDETLVWTPRIIFDGITYHMWYSGDDGTGSIGYANSTDGITWIKHPSNPVLDPGPDAWEAQSLYVPTVLFDGVTYHMWYTGYSFGDIYRIGYANSSDGINWNKYSGNPVLDIGPPGSWDDESIHSTSIFFDGLTYHMWYSGENGSDYRIGYANSSDGLNWVKHSQNPVLDMGSPGAWDDSFVFYPTVHYNDTEMTYHMWYIGSDGSTRRLGYATSQDGVNWTKCEANPVLDVGPPGTWDDSHVNIPTVLYDNATYHLWYTGDDGSNFRIGYATSSDGTNWTKIPSAPVVDLGPPGSWEENYVWAPSVIYNGMTYQMWYTGDDIATFGRIGYATSPDGIAWSKYGGNPVLDLGPPGSWDDANIDYVSVLYIGTTYHMWYSGDDGLNIRIGYATSPDGITWIKHISNPVIDLGPPGSWEDWLVWQPTVVFDGLTFHMWYIGYDGTTNRIGYATSSDGIVWTKNPANPLFGSGSLGSWDSSAISSPSVLHDGTMYRMWYSGYDGFSWKIGYAVSQNGINWTKSESNPMINIGPSGSWDDVHIYAPNVLFNGTTYQMWYTGLDGSSRRIGFANMGYQSLGNLTSSVFDSNANGTVWNFINWTEILPQMTNITLTTRSGNTSTPDASWSPWSMEVFDEIGSIITSPRSRYVQYRATLTTSDQSITPILSEVNLNYTLNTALPPTLVIPPNDIMTNDNTPTFQWVFNDNEGDSQSGFTVQIDDDPLFTSVDYSSGIVNSGSFFWTSSSPITDGIWYWRVRVRDAYDVWSEYSENWTLKIDTTPPSITDIIINPVPQEVYEFVNISANITDNFEVDDVWINISKMGNFTMLFYSNSGRYYFNQSYDSLGIFSYTIWANDTSNHWNYSIGSINIRNLTSPIIIITNVFPNPQEVFGFVNISANVTDNFQLYYVWIEVIDPNGVSQGMYLMDYNMVNREYYWNRTYDVIGTYTFTIWANDTRNNWGTEIGSFVIQDLTPPIISNVTVDPDPQEVFQDVSISADIVDNYMLDESRIEIYDPEGNLIGNFSMLYDPLNNRYYWNQTYDILGEYNFKIWTNDTSNNWASASGSFVIHDTIPPIIINVGAVPDPQEVFGTVNISASVTDNYQLFGAWVEIYDPVGVFIGNFSMFYNPFNERYYWYQTYNLVGIYTFKMWANDTSNNWAFVLSSFAIQDTSPPTITNVTAVLDPQEVYGTVNISANVTDNFQLFGVWVKVNNPSEGFEGNFSMLYDPINERYYWNQSYDLLGIYIFTIWANDTSDNWDSTSSFFVIHDTTPPMIIELITIPDPQEVFETVNISAEVTDNYQLFGANVRVTDSEGILVGNFSMLYDTDNMRYYWNQTYDVIGTYTFKILANDTSGNWAEVTNSFVILDSIPPVITNVIGEPDPQEIFNTVNISCNVTDNYQLSEVMVEIHDPDGNQVGNFSMIYNPAIRNFYWNQTYDILGTYSFTIWANDTSGNLASYPGTFEIRTTYPPVIQSVTAKPDLQVVGGEVAILASITDEDTGPLDLKVRINITSSDGVQVGNFSMIYNSTEYKFKYSSPFDNMGTYNYVIWANDPDDNWASENGTFEIEPAKEPEEYNWKPVIALIFTVILLIIGLVVVYNRPVKFTGDMSKDRWYSFFFGVLPFALAEAITGIISFFTGFFAVPPIMGLGMIVDLTILILGLISIIVIYKKGKISTAPNEEMEPIPVMAPNEELIAKPEDKEDELVLQKEEIPPMPPQSPPPPIEPPLPHE